MSRRSKKMLDIFTGRFSLTPESEHAVFLNSINDAHDVPCRKSGTNVASRGVLGVVARVGNVLGLGPDIGKGCIRAVCRGRSS